MADISKISNSIRNRVRNSIRRLDESTTLDEKVGSFARGLTNATIQSYRQPVNNFRNNRQSISNFMSKPRDFSNNRVVQGMEAINRSKPYRHLENLAVGTARGTTFGIVDPVKQFGLRELNTPLGNVTRGGAGLTMALTSGSQVIKGAKALPKVGSGITRLSTNLGNRGILGKGLSEVVQGSPLTLAYGAGSLANSFRGGENRVGRDIATDVGFDMAMGTLGPLGRGVAGFVDNKTLAKGLGSVRNDQLKESAQTILNRIKINRANGLKDTHRTQKALTKEYNKILDQMARNRKLGLSMGITDTVKVGKQTDPLTQEAKKYKSAEEFVKAQGKDTLRDIELSRKSILNDAERYRKIIAGEKLNGLQITTTKKRAKELLEGQQNQLKILDRYEKEANQLTDIYNKATKPTLKVKGNKNLPDFLQEDLRKGVKIKKPTGVDIPEIGTLDELEQGEAKVQLAEVLKSLPDDLKKTYSNWVNGRRVTDIQGLRKRTDLVPRELDEGGIDTLIDFQKGGKNPSYKPIKQYFDNKHKELESAGINLGYRNNYIPQLWNNTEEEVLQAFGKRMTHKPSFTIDRVIESYEEGIKAGLKPKFNKLSDLVGWYESYANKALSDRQFFNELVKGKYLAQGSQAPKNWATLDPDRFKSFLTRIGKDRTYAGTYKAPEPLAKAINGYLTGGSQKLGNIAGVFSGVRQRILTGGIPQMGINAHGFNILARNTLANKNPIGALLKGSYYLINPRSADKNVKANLDKLEFFAKNGLVVNASDRAYTRLDDLVEDKAIVKGVRKIGAKWEENFEKPLFEKVIPALKINYADQVYKDLKKTMSDDVAAKEASKIANNIFGGFNYEQAMRHPDTQNLMRTLLLAPDWLESNIRLGGNVAKGVIKMRDPQLKAYRTFARNFFLAFMSLQVMNMATSGKFTWDNDPGQEFSLDTGTYTKDGQKRYVRPFGTAVDFARLPYEFVSSLAKGDISYPFKAIGNRVNPVVSAGVHLAGNVDYRGNPIYGKDKYGKPMTASQQVVGVGNELSNVVGIPNPVRAVASTVTGRVSPEEGIVSALELPIRYKGGAYSKKDKELLAELQSEGASNEEIARALRGEDTKYTRSSDAPSTRLGQAGLNALSTVVNPVQTFQASRNNEPIRKLRIPEKGMGIGLLGSTTVTERQVGVGDRDGGDKNTQVDHIIPKWLGGREQDSNYQILSVQDHAKKTALGDRLRDQYENGEISRKQAISEIQKFNKTLSGQPLPKIEEKKTASSSTSVLDKEYTYTQPAPTDPLELEAYNNNILKDARSVYRSEKITEQEKQSLIEDMGLSVEDIELDTIGNAPVVERAIWVRDKLQQLPKDQHQAFLNSLYNTRTISGDRILTSSVAKKLGISGYGGSGGSGKKSSPRLKGVSNTVKIGKTSSTPYYSKNPFRLSSKKSPSITIGSLTTTPRNVISASELKALANPTIKLSSYK